jgi:pyruvate dehydrogenase E1 component beta subunit
MFGEQVKVPVVIRANAGGGLAAAAHHSQVVYSFCTHIPGLKVVVPSTPYDAKGLLIASIRDDDPVMYFEHKSLYYDKGQVPKDPYTIPLGKAEIKREGSDATVIGIMKTVHHALEAASTLEKEGVNLEVLDPRSLSPFDEEAILTSVKKTGRLVVVDESNPRCSIAADIASLLVTKGFDYLDAPIKLVTAPHTPSPFSPVLEEYYLPNADKVKQAVKEIL